MRKPQRISRFAPSSRLVGMSALLAITLLSACSDASAGASGPPPPPGITDAPAESISTLPPVPIEQPSPLSNGLEVTAVSTEPLELVANGPGEIAGSGVSVTLDFVNKATTDISLDTLTVTAYYGDRLPAAPGAADTATPVSGSLAPGEHRQGAYVFQIPEDGRDSTIFEVGHTDSQNVIAVSR